MAETKTIKDVDNFERGIKLLFESQFEKALKIFGALMEDDDVSPTLSNRAKVYRNICQKKSTPPTYTPETYDDMLNMTVLHLNLRQLDKAEEYLLKAKEMNPEHEAVFYLEAVLECDRANYQQSLNALEKAIEMDPANLIRARNDSDFQAMQELPEFKEMLEQEKQDLL